MAAQEARLLTAILADLMIVAEPILEETVVLTTIAAVAGIVEVRGILEVPQMTAAEAPEGETMDLAVDKIQAIVPGLAAAMS